MVSEGVLALCWSLSTDQHGEAFFFPPPRLLIEMFDSDPEGLFEEGVGSGPRGCFEGEGGEGGGWSKYDGWDYKETLSAISKGLK